MNLKYILLNERASLKGLFIYDPTHFDIEKGKAIEMINRSGSGSLSSSPYQTLPSSLSNFNITVHDRGLNVAWPLQQLLPTYHFSHLFLIITQNFKFQSWATTFQPSLIPEPPLCLSFLFTTPAVPGSPCP